MTILWILLWIVATAFHNFSGDGFLIFTALCMIGATID